MSKAEKQGERRQFWRELIASQKRSGKSIRAYCRERGVQEHSFYFWRVRLRELGQPVQFALVDRGATCDRGEGIEIELTSGERLRVAADAATLRLVLEVLRETRA
jgi:hypothetical protein